MSDHDDDERSLPVSDAARAAHQDRMDSAGFSPLLENAVAELSPAHRWSATIQSQETARTEALDLLMRLAAAHPADVSEVISLVSGAQEYLARYRIAGPKW